MQADVVDLQHFILEGEVLGRGDQGVEFAAQFTQLAVRGLRRDVAARRRIFLMTHYPFDEHGYFHGLRNSRALLKLLRGRANLVLLHGHNHRPYTHLVRGTAIPLYCAGSLSKAGAESFWLFDLYGDALNARRGAWRNARFTLLD